MAKFQFAFIVLLVTLAVFGCEAQKQKSRPGSQKLARQEVDAPVTPYPTADELKPEVPFEESVPAEEPTVVDEVFPEGSETIPDDFIITPEVAIVLNALDEVYGPPEIDVNTIPADVFLARQKAQKARLVQARRLAAYRQAKAAKLSAAKKSSA